MALAGPARVLIVDPRLLARARLRAIVEAEAGLAVVGEASSGARALRLSHALRPDLVLLGRSCSDVDSLEVCRRLLALQPRPAVVMLSDLSDQPAVRACLRAGARGSVRKEVLAALPEPPLSARRRAILSLVAEGLSNREIAARTNLSALTVKGYVEEILEALGARNRVQAAVLAIRRGLISAG